MMTKNIKAYIKTCCQSQKYAENKYYSVAGSLGSYFLLMCIKNKELNGSMVSALDLGPGRLVSASTLCS